ncbi:MAG: hypothetical protein EBU33_03215 [Sphingobacteriia bacterium]|nr:hypothetical protein [Sphingobacteriia bacterium]
MKYIIITALLGIMPCHSQDIPSHFWPKKVRTLEALSFNLVVPNGTISKKVPANTEVEVVSFNSPTIKLKQGPGEAIAIVSVEKTDFLLIAKAAYDSDLKNKAEQAEALAKEQSARAETLAKRKTERETALASISKLTNKELQDAYYSARNAIKNTLKAPSTAKFSNPLTDKETTGYAIDNSGRIQCKGIVDASNSFGVPLRQSWSAIVQQESSQQWRIVYATLGDDILKDTRKENPTPLDQALSSFLGMTIEELKNEFGEPLEIIEKSNATDGKFKLYSFSKEKGKETYFTIWDSDGKVESGMYQGAYLPTK